MFHRHVHVIIGSVAAHIRRTEKNALGRARREHIHELSKCGQVAEPVADEAPPPKY